MAVRKSIPFYDGIFFISITCSYWENLFEITNSYYAVYKWFDSLAGIGHYISGYVVMPNHLHCLIAFRCTQGKSINTIIGNGKRFMAYEIVKQLKDQGKKEILDKLAENVSPKDRLNDKHHHVFSPSFDWKECRTDKFVKQKLDYLHSNPCRGKWNLAANYWEYPHSSAGYYVTGIQGLYPIFDWANLKDIDLTTPIVDVDLDSQSPLTGDSA
jgi:REP element-mobilizing transposase RayT